MKTLLRTLLGLALSLGVFGGCTSSDGGGGGPLPTASACHADGECKAGNHCSGSGRCVACVVDSQCAGDQRCAAGSCAAAVACASKADCAGSSFAQCNSVISECVECLTSADCASGSSCRDNHCRAAERCAADAQCLVGAHCDLGNGSCVQCTIGAHCKPGQDCLATQCVDRCLDDAGCSGGQRCATGGHCRECIADNDCPSSQHCAGNACVPDTCQKGTVTCTDTGLRTCDAHGAESTDSACPASTTCVRSGTNATCQPWLCSPGLGSCNEAKDGTRTCDANGLAFAAQQPCAEGEHCQSGKCITGACLPNQLLCKDGASHLCAPDGQSSAFQTSCTSNDFCDEGVGACRAKVCTPGAVSCGPGSSVGTCRTDGSGYELKACAANEACVPATGTCQPFLCPAGRLFCQSDASIRLCAQTGTSSVAYNTCYAGSHCVGEAFGANCQYDSCTPGSAVCNGSLATVCKSDGTGAAAGGTDCGAVNGSCVNGLCVGKVCTPSQLFCSGDISRQCAFDGTSSAVYQNCPLYGWRCNRLTGACESPKCTASTTYCQNGAVTQCAADGFTVTQLENCDAVGKACVNGACMPKLCSPNDRYCKGNAVYRCNEYGTSEFKGEVCAGSSYCSGGYCAATQCTPNQPLCNGNAVAACAADGSGPASAGTPCSVNEVCVAGACESVACTPNTRFCVGGDVQRCNPQGTGTALFEHCFSDSYCADGQCKPDVCSGPTCTGESLMQCNADGSALIAPGIDCKASAQVCLPSGCAATAVETVGREWAGFTFYYALVVESFSSSTARRLKQIELNMRSASTGTLRFVVWSSTTNSNFTQLFSSAEMGPFAPGWASSGPIDVLLPANRFYLIGVVTNQGSVSPWYWNKTSSMSFATGLSGVHEDPPNTAAPYTPKFLSPEINLNLRLTTTLP